MDLKGESLCWRINPAEISGVSDQAARGKPAVERGLMLEKIRADDPLEQAGECKKNNLIKQVVLGGHPVDFEEIVVTRSSDDPPRRHRR